MGVVILPRSRCGLVVAPSILICGENALEGDIDAQVTKTAVAADVRMAWYIFNLVLRARLDSSIMPIQIAISMSVFV